MIRVQSVVVIYRIFTHGQIKQFLRHLERTVDSLACKDRAL